MFFAIPTALLRYLKGILRIPGLPENIGYFLDFAHFLEKTMFSDFCKYLILIQNHILETQEH